MEVLYEVAWLARMNTVKVMVWYGYWGWRYVAIDNDVSTNKVFLGVQIAYSLLAEGEREVAHHTLCVIIVDYHASFFHRGIVCVIEFIIFEYFIIKFLQGLNFSSYV